MDLKRSGEVINSFLQDSQKYEHGSMAYGADDLKKRPREPGGEEGGGR